MTLSKVHTSTKSTNITNASNIYPLRQSMRVTTRNPNPTVTLTQM